MSDKHPNIILFMQHSTYGEAPIIVAIMLSWNVNLCDNKCFTYSNMEIYILIAQQYHKKHDYAHNTKCPCLGREYSIEEVIP